MLKVYNVILTFWLTINLRKCYGESNNVSQTDRSSVPMITLARAGVELCKKHCGEREECMAHPYVKASLSCNPRTGKLAIAWAIIRHEQEYSTAFIKVVKKEKWQTCQKLQCSVTAMSYCTSSAEKDCRPVTKKISENDGKSSAAERHNSTFLWPFMAASKRYPNIIYGHARRGENIDKLFTVNYFENNAANEHTVDFHRPIRNIGKQSMVLCGMTTAPGLPNHTPCLYICYSFVSHGQPFFRVRVFPEIDIYKTKINIHASYLTITRQLDPRSPILDIAVDVDSNLYVLKLYHRTKLSITIAYRFVNSIFHKDVKLKLIKLSRFKLKINFLVIRKSKAEVLLLGKDGTLYRQAVLDLLKGADTISGHMKEVQMLTGVYRMCLLSSENHILVTDVYHGIRLVRIVDE